MEIVPGIHQLKVPIPDNPLGYVNSYLVQGSKGWLLVDVGWNSEDAFNSLDKQLAELGLDFRDITQIVVTHIHPDHYGLAGRLKQLSGAELLLHHRDEVNIEQRYVKIESLLDQMGRWLYINGVPEEGELKRLIGASLSVLRLVTPVWPDKSLYGGEVISTGLFNFEVLWTPGHSPGHICLYEHTRKLLLSGDHILPVITPNVSRNVQSMNNPLGGYLDSLQKMKHLDAELILPAHEQVFTGLRSRIEQLLRHHEQRKADIVDIIQNGPQTAYEIASKLHWETGGVPWVDMSSFDKRSAVMETLAHLEMLRLEERVEQSFKGDIIFHSVSRQTVKG